MDEEKQQKKKGSIFYRIGITLITISLFIWIIPIVVPFLSISGGLKASLIGGAVLIAEILFWVGAVLAGKEVATRIRGYVNPKNWRRRKIGRASFREGVWM